MCGIAGIIRITPPDDADGRRHALTRSHFDAIPEAWLDLLDESIKHRGPDGQGRFRDRAIRADGSVVDVALVHRRLSIIDHACGAQPMVSVGGRGKRRAASDERRGTGEAGERASLPPPLVFHGEPNDRVQYQPLAVGPDDDLVAVVFNGCIYNHRELRAELQAAGHEFVTDHSDTEVLVHGWREWGPELFRRSNGMYATAHWSRAHALVLARDPFGEKPLYQFNTDSNGASVGAFSSALPGLHRFAEVSQSGNARAIALSWLLGWVRFGWSQSTPFERIGAISPGLPTVFRGDDEGGEQRDGFEEFGWWHSSLNPCRDALDAAQVEDSIRASVHGALEADVPLACFLSGGIDSALVAKFALERRPDLHSFTVRMPNEEYDESAAAAQTATALGMQHQILDCRAFPTDDLIALIRQLGLPFGDSSLLPTHWVSRAAREHVTVALSGDGGDEMFLGYDRHRIMRAMARAGRMPKKHWRAIASLPLADGDPRSLRTRAWRFASAASNQHYKDLLAIFPSPLDAKLGLEDESGKPLWWHFGMDASRWSVPVEDQLMLALRIDRLFYLPEDLLRKTDTAAMAVALEVRAPLLGRGVAQLAMNATPASLMPRGQRKGLLRQVARKYLPASIVDRPKQGFAIPIGEWFRTDYGGMKTLLLDRLNSVEPFGPPSLGIDLNRRFIQQMIDEHMSQKRDHSQRLYMLLVLSLWTDSLKG